MTMGFLSLVNSIADKLSVVFFDWIMWKRTKLRTFIWGCLIAIAGYFTMSLYVANRNSIKVNVDHCVENNKIITKALLPRLPLCPVTPAELNLTGQTTPNVTKPASLREVELQTPYVWPGGRWKPSDCLARHNVAIIVPYRDRELQLLLFLRHIHPFLQRQKIAYTIYLLEQAPNKIFNRGLDRNIGFVESLNFDPTHECTMFHDVDLLPLDSRNMYSCPDQPRHVCIALNSWNNFMPLYNVSWAEFGHVTFFRNDHFRLINGYSNIYLGWGAEDDDIHARLRAKGMHVYRYPDVIGRFYAIPHASEKDAPRPNSTAKDVNRFKLLHVAAERLERDGLNTMKYTVLKTSREPLFTRIYFDVEQDQYADQAVKEEQLYGEMYRNLSPYWKKMAITPKPYWWNDTEMSNYFENFLETRSFPLKTTLAS